MLLWANAAGADTVISVMPIATVLVAEIDKVFSEVMGSEDALLGVNTSSLMPTVHPMMLATLVGEVDHRGWRARKNPAMSRVWEVFVRRGGEISRCIRTGCAGSSRFAADSRRDKQVA